MMGGAFMGTLLAQQGGKAWVNPYVTDGLVAMWDGEWNAGGGVHDSNANAWKDLVGVYDLDKSSGSWNAQSFAGICGVNRFGPNRTAFNNTIIASTATTFEIVVNLPSGTFQDDIVDSTSWGRLQARNNYGVMLSHASAEFKAGNGLQYIGTGTKLFSFTQGVGVASDLYINATYKQSGASGFSKPASDSSIRLGSSVYDIYVARVYNRILSQTEISTNYAVDKARFNLP